MPFELETAPHPENLKRVAIEPVSRVEGHGKVTILLDDDNKVQQVRLHIVEFRGFEQFILGRPYWEVPVMVQRLCGICPVSHHLAASKAMDMMLGVTLTPTAEKVRRLMHYGQMMQSHALHFFHLSSPDLLFGFGSDMAKRNIVGVIAAEPEIAKKGVFLRKYGQEVIRMTSGKRVHGTSAIPGGVSKSLSAEDRATLLKDAYQMVAWSRDAVHLMKGLFEQNLEQYNAFGRFSAHSLGLIRADGAMDLYHGGLRARRADGSTLFDHFDYGQYMDVIMEDVKSWSYMKFPFFRSMGNSDEGWYRVGPLARVTQCDFIATPLADKERKDFMGFDNGSATGSTLGYHWARMIEMLHAAESIKDLLHDDDICGSELMATGQRQERGVGVLEAPRGTLIHDYSVDENDQVTHANLIVSTTHNNQAMNESIRVVAKQYLDGKELTEGLLNHIEVAIRCFDPCLSCATHALGQMPLEVTLVGADGTTIDRMTRDMHGVCTLDTLD